MIMNILELVYYGASDRHHEEDKGISPERHYFTKKIYSRVEALSMCCKCAKAWGAQDMYFYDARTNQFIRKASKEDEPS